MHFKELHLAFEGLRTDAHAGPFSRVFDMVIHQDRNLVKKSVREKNGGDEERRQAEPPAFVQTGTRAQGVSVAKGAC